MRFRIKLVIVTAFVGAVIATILSWAGNSSPVQEGTSVELWKHACRVDLTSDSVVLGGCKIYLPEPGCCVYYDQGMHGQSMYQVYSEAAADELPTVIRAVEAHADELPPWVRVACANARAAGADAQSAELLLHDLQAAYMDYLRREDPEIGDMVRDQVADFHIFWSRYQRYWLTVFFEIVWLSGLIFLLALPWLRNWGRIGWAICLAALPTVLFLPYYFGYAPFTFTSAFPVGGVFYPYVLQWVSIPFRLIGFDRLHLDSLILSNLPQVLEPLSQLPGPMMSLSGGPTAGPVAVGGFGIVLGLALLGACRALRRLRMWCSGD